MNLKEFKQSGITDKKQLHGFRVAQRVKLLRQYYKLLYAAYMQLGDVKFTEMLQAAAKLKSSSELELKKVSNFIGIPVDELKQKTRKRHIVEARQVAMYMAKLNTKESLTIIGMKIGGKDHATVIHACRTVSNLLQTNHSFRNKWKELINI